jgi:hypothetical protein
LFNFSLPHKIIPRIVFGSNRKEATKGLKIWHTDKTHDLYSTPFIVRMTRSRMMRLVRHATLMEEKIKVAYIEFFWNTPGKGVIWKSYA